MSQFFFKVLSAYNKCVSNNENNYWSEVSGTFIAKG